MAATKDYYAILGVEKTATEEEIRKAFKKLARKHHPDFNPGNKEAEKRFKELNEAHGALADPEKRKRYDEFGEVGLKEGFDPRKAREWAKWGGGGGGGAPGGGFPGGFEFNFGGPGGAGGGGGFEDILSAFGVGGAGRAGGGRRRRASAPPPPEKGGDIESALEVPLVDALRGSTAAIEMDRGQGRERIEVKIPAGVKDGQKIRLGGMGAPGAAGPGDLLVKIAVAPGKRLRRQEDDLVLEVPVSLGEAIRGAEITIPTPLSGEATVKVPAGTSSGQTLRLRGQGVKRKDGTAGDLLVRILIRLPKGAAEELKDLAEKAERLYAEPPRKDFTIE